MENGSIGDISAVAAGAGIKRKRMEREKNLFGGLHESINQFELSLAETLQVVASDAKLQAAFRQ